MHAIKFDTEKLLPCSLILKGEYGHNNLSMTVPAIVGKGGVKEIQEWRIAADEEEELAVSTKTIGTSMKFVEETIGITGV